MCIEPKFSGMFPFPYAHSWVDRIFGLEKNPKIQHILDLELEFKSQWRTWTFDHWIGSKIQVQNFCGPELK